MSRIRTVLAWIVVITVAAAACDQQGTVAPENSITGPRAQTSNVLDGDDGCTPTGTGLTAVVVNEDVVRQTIDIGDCDVGAFFDEDGVVKNATFKQPAADAAPNEQFLVRVGGGNVEVTGSKFDVNPRYAHQILHIAYVGGARGEVVGNRLSGRKRVGILLDGAGTSAQVLGNIVAGVGPTNSGWAENGIQVSRGATGTIQRNRVMAHWWDGRGFCSSGVIIFGSDEVSVEDNNVKGSDCGIVLWGDANRAGGNHIAVQDRDAETAGFFGVWVVNGEGNDVQENLFRSKPTNPADLGILDSGSSTTITGNIINGFSTAIDSDNAPDTNVLTPAAERSPDG